MVSATSSTEAAVPRGPAAVRAATEDDAAAIAAIYRPYVERDYASFEEQPPDEAELRRRMTARPRLPWLVGVRDGDVVGYAYAATHRARPAYRWTTETSVYLRADEQGRGTGRAMYQALLREVRELGYVQALAGIALPNPGSVGLHEAVGFTAVGVLPGVGYKQGGWHDVGWWALALADRADLGDPPPEPREWQSQ